VAAAIIVITIITIITITTISIIIVIIITSTMEKHAFMLLPHTPQEIDGVT
jgi:hypothetical protein